MGLFKKNKKEENKNVENNTTQNIQPEKVETTVQTQNVTNNIAPAAAQTQNQQAVQQTTTPQNLQPQNQVQNTSATENNTISEAQKEEPKKENEPEIVELDDKNDKIENTLNNRKENRLLFIIIAGLILFVIFLPTITSFVNRNSIFTYTKNVEDITNSKTVDGMLEIGKDEGTITAKEIRFYNPTKKSNNEIQIVYLPETGISNVKNLNLYVEFYNSNKTVIYRTPFDSENKLERKVQGTFSVQVNQNIYSEAVYAKVSIIEESDLNEITDTLVCTNNFKDENYNVEQKITYNFSNKGLISYQVSKLAEKIEDSSDDDETNIDEENENNNIDNKYSEAFKKEATELNKTNIEKLEYDDETIIYTIDLKNIELGKSNYELLYKLGSVKRQIKLGEEAKKWSCK